MQETVLLLVDQDVNVGLRRICISVLHIRNAHITTKVSALVVPSELTVGKCAVENSSLEECTGMSTPAIRTKD